MRLWLHYLGSKTSNFAHQTSNKCNTRHNLGVQQLGVCLADFFFSQDSPTTKGQSRIYSWLLVRHSLFLATFAVWNYCLCHDVGGGMKFASGVNANTRSSMSLVLCVDALVFTFLMGHNPCLLWININDAVNASVRFVCLDKFTGAVLNSRF